MHLVVPNSSLSCLENSKGSGICKNSTMDSSNQRRWDEESGITYLKSKSSIGLINLWHHQPLWINHYLQLFGNLKVKRKLIFSFAINFCSSEVLQRNCPNQSLLPSVFSLCFALGESLNHIFFDCSYAWFCWFKIFAIFNVQWVFSNIMKNNTSLNSVKNEK